MWTLVALACTEFDLVAPGAAAPEADPPAVEPAETLATPPVDDAARGRLALWPADLDLQVAKGCAVSHPITVRNEGTEPVWVASVAETGEFTIAGPPTPFVIGPAEEVVFDVSFAGAASGVREGRLQLLADDAVGRHLATQTVAVVAPGPRVERFVQGPFDGVDVILTLDETASMEGVRADLAAQFSHFVDAMAAAGVDWRLAVVTLDDGCANGGVLGPATPDLAARFVEASHIGTSTVNYGFGDYGARGWYAEAGLTLARSALNAYHPGGCNAELIGPDALGAVVMVSDERDQSDEPWFAITQQLLATRPATSLHAIAGDVPGGCPTATPGEGYFEATAATSGMFLSICQGDRAFAWRALADSLTASATSHRQVFELAQGAPGAGTLIVRVDGAASSGWSYDGTRNAVVFRDPPPPGSVVTIAYEDAGTCGF